MTAISLNLDFAKEDPHIQEAIGATQRMEALLKTARKQFIRTDDVQEFSIADEIEQTVLLLSQKCKQASVRINTDLVENVHVLGMPIKFFRVMMNILSNAIDAYESSDVPARERVVRVSCIGSEGAAMIEVTDFGIGIPKDFLDKIFLPFFSTKNGKGSGFGLAMAKQIVEEDFHGSISVKSQPSQGTTFTIELPL